MKPNSNMGMGFIALVVAGLLGYSAIKGKSITDTVFLREGSAPEGSGAGTSEGGTAVATAEGAPTGNYPKQIQQMIAFASSISGKYDYAWGGGHQTIGQPSPGGLNGSGGRIVTGFDCSGAVSGVLHAAGLLSHPLTSGELTKWGVSGKGKYATVYCNAEHTFMRIGNKWFGTGHIGKGGGGPEWGNHDQTVTYEARHWPGL